MTFRKYSFISEPDPKSGETVQDRLLSMQTEQRPHRARIADIALIAVFLLVIYGFAAATFITPDVRFSETENRELQQLPKLSTPMDGTLAERIAAGRFLDRLLSGRFASETSAWFADQFPLRGVAVELKAMIELASLKAENNNVMLGSGGVLIERNDRLDTEKLGKNLAAAEAFAEYAITQGKTVTFALAGSVFDMAGEYYPAIYGTGASHALWSAVLDRLGSLEDVFLDLRGAVGGDGAYRYYKTDHHWTTEGAYRAYAAIMESMGIEPYSESEFTSTRVSDKFYGTTWSSSGMSWVGPDEMWYWRWDGDEDVTVRINDSGREIKGLYDTSYLDKKDKYSSFVGGNNALLYIYEGDSFDDDGRECLLLIKDSFAHSVAPFLARYFKIIMVDPRYYKKAAADLLPSADRVLFLYSPPTLAESTSLTILRAGIDKQ